jgi:site-specific recombinase XerD
MRNPILNDLPLPPGVSIHHGSYVLRKNRKKITLSRVILGEGALKEALQRLPIAEVATPQTMHELFECYKESVNGKRLGLALLAPSTQKQYINMIDRYLDPGFGNMRLGTLTAGNVTKYLTYRYEGHIVAPNKKNPKRGVVAAANRERAVLSAVLSYAESFDWLKGGNVVKMTKKVKERPRKRSVTSEEMIVAKSVVPAWYTDYFEFLYLTGMHGRDARAMTRAKLDALGLHFQELKTGKERNISWSETLTALIERCFERNRARAKRYKLVESDYLFCGKSGQPLTESAVQSMLGRMKKQGHRGPVGNTWNGHDWRAATATDTKGKSLGEGHTRPDIYDGDGYTAPVK